LLLLDLFFSLRFGIFISERTGKVVLSVSVFELLVVVESVSPGIGVCSAAPQLPK
jgi:hypothetical protein